MNDTFSSFDRFYELEKNECKYCTKKFSSKQAWSRHQAHCGKFGKKWVCEKCAKLFRTEIGLLTHKSKHEDEDAQRTFICQTCSKVYKNLGELRRHCGLLKHNFPVMEGPVLENEARCEVCFIVVQSHNLQSHMNKRHSNIQVYKCDKCSYETMRHNNFLRHKRIKHNSKKLNVDIIKKTFERAEEHGKGFSCPRCRKLFHSIEETEMHLLQKDCADDGGTICEVCNKKFTMKQNLKAHVKRKHPEYFEAK